MLCNGRTTHFNVQPFISMYCVRNGPHTHICITRSWISWSGYASINVFIFKLGHHKKRSVNPKLHFKWMHKNKTMEVWWLKPWFHQRYGLCYRRENRNMSIAKNPPQGIIECGVCEPDHVSQPKHIITKTERIFEQTVAPQAGRVLSEPTHSTCMQSMMSISCVQ